MTFDWQKITLSQDGDIVLAIRASIREKVVAVVHTKRGDNIRIISARLASRRERRSYEKTT